MPAAFDHLRLLADDLTGALDSAVAFVRAFGPLEVGDEGAEGTSLVLDSATRELSTREAMARVRRLSPMLGTAPGRLTFFKVDSLLRGHAGAELAVILAANAYSRVVIAPALPAQGRATRDGRQVMNGQATGEEIAATLRAHGHALLLRKPGDRAERISLFDAETDADLDRIVRDTLALPGSTLWVGTGGLAAALGRALPVKAIAPVLAPPMPLLGFVGTDHPVMQTQLSGVRRLRIGDDGVTSETLRRIHVALRECNAIFVTCDLPQGMPRDAAHRLIARSFAECLAPMPRPGTLFASGGETLRALLAPLGRGRYGSKPNISPACRFHISLAVAGMTCQSCRNPARLARQPSSKR